MAKSTNQPDAAPTDPEEPQETAELVEAPEETVPVESESAPVTDASNKQFSTAAQPSPVVAMSSQDYRQQQAVRSMEEAAAKQLDVAPPGGRYIVNGKLVDADGNALKK